MNSEDPSEPLAPPSVEADVASAEPTAPRSADAELAAPEEAPSAPSAPGRNEVGAGLAFLHGVVGAGVLSHAETSAHLYALTELLISKGIVGLREFEQRKAAATQSTMQQTLEHWPGAKVLPDESNKYEAEPADIDCLSRLHLCKAACCRLTFNLSRQDVAEGVVEWDFANPYHIKQREDGYCTHCRPGVLSCAVREHRPIVCRVYDCRQDARIWDDFEGRVPSAAVREL